MNHNIVKEMYKISLLTKLNQYPQQELKGIIKDNDIFGDIQKLISNSELFFVNYKKEKCYMFKYINTIYINVHSELYHQKNRLKQWLGNIYVNETLLETSLCIKEQLYKNIELIDKENKVKKIYVSGFGMGGAFAMLLASILAEKYDNMYLISCFTFGTTFVGNNNFKKYFDKYINTNYTIKLDTDNSYSDIDIRKHISNIFILCKDNIYMKKTNEKTLLEKIKDLLCVQQSTNDDNQNIETYIDNLKSIIQLFKINNSKTKTDSDMSDLVNRNQSSNTTSSSRDSSNSPENKNKKIEESVPILQSANAEKILTEINHKLNSIHNLIINHLDTIEESSVDYEDKNKECSILSA